MCEDDGKREDIKGGTREIFEEETSKKIKLSILKSLAKIDIFKRVR